MSAIDAIRYAYSTVGTALWAATIVPGAGFSVLALSSFKMNTDMGLLTAITIGLALMQDFLFLAPFILMTKESNDEDTNNNPVA